jgi:hypothetical protein
LPTINFEFHLSYKIIVEMLLFLVFIGASSQLLSSIELVKYVVSDANALVVGPDVKGLVRAVAANRASTWSANIPGATWIWDNASLLNSGNYQYCKFFSYFEVVGVVKSVTLDLAADCMAFAFINGIPTRCSSQTNSATLATQLNCDVTHLVSSGMNLLTVRVTNMVRTGSSDGYSGVLYKLTISSTLSIS